MTTDDEWVKVAMNNDTVVVDMLLRLNRADSPPVKRTFLPPPTPALPLKWTVRQRRSKSVPDANKKGEGESSRASPTTPLSWSGATSVSGGGGGAPDGSEESSRPVKPSDGARSKVIPASEATTSKRSRKKKTLLELKEEESLLLKERKRLKNELATLRVTVEKQRATNANLRIKFDTELQSAAKTATTCVTTEGVISDQHRQIKTTCDSVPSASPTSFACNDPIAALHHSPANEFPKKDFMNQDQFFLLPDLNLPCEEVSGSKVLCGRIS